MKRFYCTICKKVRRVRRYPVIIDSPNAFAVTERVGECNWHHSHNSKHEVRREKVSVR